MKRHFILLSGLCIALASCTSSDGTMNKGLLGAASGGLIGALIGDGLLNGDDNSSSSGSSSGGGSGSSSGSSDNGGFLEDNSGLITGAVAGYAAGAISDSFAKNEVRQKYLDGYNKGRSDAIKELYWVKRDAERPTEDSSIQRRYYEVPVPEHVTTDGVLVEPRKVVIEVVE
ncbi:hypothetical protein [Prosthecobacter dejongeii]|uniref:Putative membrane protein YeaQ/YmgE (Transglycosylase-associated protein family) n=1 Tax=Prosthecobacter dejongeii TaxID=48465 RepID=A0A7W7YNW6_9BACT|nr:hypothetical protein [Prosthecobacter dejongeii]MBB5039628.1 putative membrane protein YeaQ/YmgE (transglycosylase-associated protein family) [Prosthecobacter dejongeii]